MEELGRDLAFGIVVLRARKERKRAENELRRINTLLNNIFENIPNMIFLKDAKELRYVRLNKAGEELVGYPRDDS